MIHKHKLAGDNNPASIGAYMDMKAYQTAAARAATWARGMVPGDTIDKARASFITGRARHALSRDGVQYKIEPKYKIIPEYKSNRSINPIAAREYGTGIRRAIMPDPIWKSVRVYHAIQPGKEWQHLKDTSTLAEIREMFK